MQMVKRISGMAVVILFASTGAVTCARAQGAPVRLTMGEAIQRGLQANLRIRAAGTRIDEAAAARERRSAGLLPRARIENTASLQNRSLAAFGISAPGIPDVVPLFSTYDFRIYAEQPLFDRQAYHGWKAGQRQEEVVQQDYQDTRDQIVRLVSGLYLKAQAAAARVQAAQSRVSTAEELDRLARERHNAGVATGVDVLRAQVELANARQRLLEAQNDAKQALVVLARNIGMSPGTPIELADGLRFQPLAPPDVGAALTESLLNRADYRALAAQRSALTEQQKANHARWYPRLSIAGNYGGIGRAVGQVQGTGTLQGTLSFTVFDRDRDGEQREIESRIQRLDYQMADLRLGLEEDIRTALLALDSSAEEVRVAQQGEDLANKELELARERFQAGVANNLEVISAQASLERAQDNRILAMTRYSDAKMALARALGGTEKNYTKYMQ
jgi:outer membrane protein TolC